ncbi:MAG: 6,7-dimethyl-8-ribityllumazine synthase [Bdellovibrionota bacterium]
MLNASGLSFGIVVARFNGFITERLLEGALDCLRRHGADEGKVDVYRVPGAFEIPMLLSRLASGKKYDALVCLGCVIRGGTSHYDHVCNEAFKGISSAALESGIPIGAGIVTADSIEQAIERAGSKMGNKGADAALAALEMASLYRAAGLSGKSK